MEEKTRKEEGKMRDKIFGRINEDGTVDILHATDGERVTRLDTDLFPIDSPTGTRYEHPEGIVLSLTDARSLGIEIEAR